MKVTKEQLKLYAVTDRTWLEGKTLDEAVEEALKGGATMVQLREKNADRGKIFLEALNLKILCAKYHAPLIIDDDVDLAILSGATGVHVGQSDMEASKVRDLIGPQRILGVTARTVEEAVAAEKAGADYLGAGAVFPTGTKTDTRPMSFETLKAICEAVSIPVVAIGGIRADNISSLSGSGIAGVAVVSGIFAQPDIRKASETLRAHADKL